MVRRGHGDSTEHADHQHGRRNVSGCGRRPIRQCEPHRRHRSGFRQQPADRGSRSHRITLPKIRRARRSARSPSSIPILPIRTPIRSADPRFEIVGGQLRLAAGSALDFETEPSVALAVTATGSVGRFGHRQPSPSSSTIATKRRTAVALAKTTFDANSFGATVGALTVADPDVGDTHTYSVDDPRFEVVNGTLETRADRELPARRSATVVVTATDAGGLRMRSRSSSPRRRPAAAPERTPAFAFSRTRRRCRTRRHRSRRHAVQRLCRSVRTVPDRAAADRAFRHATAGAGQRGHCTVRRCSRPARRCSSK